MVSDDECLRPCYQNTILIPIMCIGSDLRAVGWPGMARPRLDSSQAVCGLRVVIKYVTGYFV